MLGEAEKASGAAKEYFEVAFPVSKEDAAKTAARKEKSIRDIESMGPMRMVNGKIAPVRGR